MKKELALINEEYGEDYDDESDQEFTIVTRL